MLEVIIVNRDWRGLTEPFLHVLHHTSPMNLHLLGGFGKRLDELMPRQKKALKPASFSLKA